MRGIAPRGGALVLALGLVACESAAALDGAGKALVGAEAAAARRKSDEALANKEFAVAWNLEVHAGKDRSRLETIAVAALEAGAGDAEDMFEQLRKAHGRLTDGGRARVRALAVAAEGRGDWDRAAEIEITAADDPPAYAQAWDVYGRAPAKRALEVLRRVEKARAAREEAGSKPGA
jgi:hypothetical protein